jgi:phage head maturation protease/predicted  nucleic acid-binding Zn-ribbon protein
MKEFSKASWSVEGDSIRTSVEFSKINKQKRLISGWATIDNVDTENDVVTAEASVDAFNRARGNLREMHKKDSAVGRIVSFKQKEFQAPDGKTYNGIFVTARISEGAENTWLKVLDGTLSGFSIGGEIVEAEETFNKDSGDKIRKVTKYDLNELSVVDNPGNQYSDITNIFKFKKSAGGSVTSLTGMVEEHKILNVFFCDEHGMVINSPADSYACPADEKEMDMLGFIEDGADREKKVNTLVTKYISEGGENMLKKNKGDESVETGHEAGDPQEVPTPARTEEDVVEEVEAEEETPKADVVDEVVDEGDQIANQIDNLKKSIKEILDDNKTETTAKIEALEKTFKETKELFEKKISEVDNKLSNLDSSLEAAKSRVSTFEKMLNKMNSTGAFRKSVVSDEVTEEEQIKDPWANSAFSVHDLTR